MNSYSLASDSRRWWWPSAAAGILGTAAVAAILVVPTTGSATPAEPPAPGIGTSGPVTVVERPCYLARPGWNTVRGWEQPVCTTVVGRGSEDTAARGRPAPDYLP